MNDIYLKIEKYRYAAAELRRMADDLGDSRLSMTGLMGFIGDAWQGTAADVFLESSEWTVKDIERLRFDLEDLAANIDTEITVLEEASLNAKGRP